MHVVLLNNTELVRSKEKFLNARKNSREIFDSEQIDIILILQKIKKMEYQSKNHKQNCQNKTKSIQEWQKSPLTSEEKLKHLESHFQAHNQVNPNKSILETDKK